MRWMCGAQYLQGPRAGVQAGGEVRPAPGGGRGGGGGGGGGGRVGGRGGGGGGGGAPEGRASHYQHHQYPFHQPLSQLNHTPFRR
jgi:hypothetical protein